MFIQISSLFPKNFLIYSPLKTNLSIQIPSLKVQKSQHKKHLPFYKNISCHSNFIVHASIFYYFLLSFSPPIAFKYQMPQNTSQYLHPLSSVHSLSHSFLFFLPPSHSNTKCHKTHPNISYHYHQYAPSPTLFSSFSTRPFANINSLFPLSRPRPLFATLPFPLSFISKYFLLYNSSLSLAPQVTTPLTVPLILSSSSKHKKGRHFDRPFHSFVLSKKIIQ